VQDSVEVAVVLTDTLVGLRVQERLLGEDEDVSVTEPVKPFKLVIVTVEVAFEPGLVVTIRGFIVILKLETLIVTVIE
jgi:hypothetical protein